MIAKTEKRLKNNKSTIKPLSTTYVPCMKIQGGMAPLPPAADAHAYVLRYQAGTKDQIKKNCELPLLVLKRKRTQTNANGHKRKANGRKRKPTEIKKKRTEVKEIKLMKVKGSIINESL